MVRAAEGSLLYLPSVWPEPGSSAAGSRVVDLVRCFRAAGWRVAMACDASPTEHSAAMDAWGVTTHSITLNCSSFDAFVRAQHPDVVVFERFSTEEQYGWRVAEQCPDALRVLDTQDLHLLRRARQAAVQRGLRAEDADLHTDTALREVASILRADLTLLVSPAELDLLVQQFGVDASLLHHCPLLVWPEGIDRGEAPPFARRAGFATIGNFRHAPNADAAQLLQAAVWPLIRRSLPHATLHLYGAYPSRAIEALHCPRKGVVVHGRAKDVRDVMHPVRVLLAPLRFGAGIKGKLLDAMRFGTPTVTTAIGAEGMHGGLPWGGIIADEPETLAQAAVLLHEDEALWSQARDQGTALVRTLYQADEHCRALLSRIHQCRQDVEARRRRNFVGAMLRHHQHQSLRYLSKWIEAKSALGQASPDRGASGHDGRS